MATPVFSVLSTTLLFLWFSLEKGHAYQVTQTQFHHLVQVNSLLPSAVCNPPSSKGNDHKSASLKVLHRHGPCSEFIQGKATAPNLTTILQQDQARVNSIQLRFSQHTNTSQTSADSKKTTLPAMNGSSVGSTDYIVTVGLGTPANQLSLIFDTGSDLTWTQCEPCANCHEQKDPIFDPSKSTSYTNITCTSPLCAELRSATEYPPGCSTTTCVYSMQYGDLSYTSGFFGKEKLTLTPTDYVDNFLFGCGQNNQGRFDGSAGILGLGRDKLSIVSQTAQKYGNVFSYCLPPPSTSAGYLSFGNPITSKTLKFSPINSEYPSFYIINMVGISVGGNKLSIPESVFSSGIIMDSGTVITRLPTTAYAAMRTAFRQLMSNYTMVGPSGILDTCYDLSKYGTATAPNISYIFSGDGGAEVDVDLPGVFYAVSTAQVCLAVTDNGGDEKAGILGNVQQQTLDVVYDLAAGMLGFGAGGC